MQQHYATIVFDGVLCFQVRTYSCPRRETTFYSSVRNLFDSHENAYLHYDYIWRIPNKVMEFYYYLLRFGQAFAPIYLIIYQKRLH